MSLKESDPLDQPPSNRGAIIALSIITLVIVVLIVVFSLTDDDSSESITENTNTTMNINASPNKNATISNSNASRTEADNVFTVNGENFQFSNTELKVKKGDRVKIVFTSTQGIHDWSLPSFSATTETVSAGGSTSIEFTADREGTFDFFCGVGDHKALGMTGRLIVE